MGTDDLDWHEQRSRSIAAHAAALERSQAAETAKAQTMIEDFVRQARERAIPAEPLTAHAYNGRGRYRTGLRGWYIHSNGLYAVGEDGAFYVLTVPASLGARFTGATVTPSPPPLVIGRGGKDGESMPLGVLLQRRLDKSRN